MSDSNMDASKKFNKLHRRGKFLANKGSKTRKSFSGIFQAKRTSTVTNSSSTTSYTPSLSVAQINTNAIDDRLLEREKMRMISELERKKKQRIQGVEDMERRVLEELEREAKNHRRRKRKNDQGKIFMEDAVLKQKKMEFRELVGHSSDDSENYLKEINDIVPIPANKKSEQAKSSGIKELQNPKVKCDKPFVR